MNPGLAISQELPSPVLFRNTGDHVWITLDFIVDLPTAMSLLWVLCYYGFISIF